MKHGYIRVNITFNVYFTKIKTGHWSLFFYKIGNWIQVVENKNHKNK